MPAPTFDELEVSPHVEFKINNRHHVSVDNVLDVLEHPDFQRWDHDPDRGLRLLVVGTLGQRTIVVVLYPTAEENVWRLATAYPIEQL